MDLNRNDELLSFTPQDQANAWTVLVILGFCLMGLSDWLVDSRHLGEFLGSLMLLAGFVVVTGAGYRIRQAAGGTKPFTGRTVGRR